MFSSLRKLDPFRVAASAGLKGALPKVLLGAALLGGGGSVLSAGSAQAQTVNPCADGDCLFSEWAAKVDNVAINPLLTGDKKFTYSSHTGDLIPTDPLQSISVSGVQINPTDYLFNLDFAPFSNISEFTLNYIAEVTNPDNFFAGVDLDSDVNALDPPSERLGATWKTGSFAGPVVAALQSVNGSPSQAAVAGHPKILYVTNVYDSNGGSIDAFVNSYRQGTKIPGPLPLLGAGMAFGFSRKLRSRIKARVQA